MKFSLDREPGNPAAEAMLEKLRDQDPHNAYVTTLAEEKTFNTFFRLTSPGVIAALKGTTQDPGDSPDEKKVFLALRALRNDW